MRMTLRATLFCLCTAAIVVAIPGAGVAQQSGTNDYKKVVPSVVLVETPVGSGTGFAFGRPGDYLTNAHVVGIASGVAQAFPQVQITDEQGHKVTADVVKADFDRDVALLHSSRLQLPPLSPPSIPVETGDFAFTVGNPEGQDFSYSDGKISRAKRVRDGKNFIQTTVNVNHGNSGGPLLDSTRRVTGITSAVKYESSSSVLTLLLPTSRTDGIAFAIPIKEAADAVGAQYSVPEPAKKTSHKHGDKKSSGSGDGITISTSTLIMVGGGLAVLLGGLALGLLMGKRQRNTAVRDAVPAAPPVVYRTPDEPATTAQPEAPKQQVDDFEIVIKPAPPEDPTDDQQT